MGYLIKKMIKNFINRALYNYVGDGQCTSHNVAFLDKDFIKAYNKAFKIVSRFKPF